MAAHASRLDPPEDTGCDPAKPPRLNDALTTAAHRTHELQHGSLTPGDARVLVALAAEIVAASERARRETSGERLADVGVVGGLALLGFGAAAILAAVLGHLAVALPLTELAVRPALWPGALATVAGFLILLVARRRAR